MLPKNNTSWAELGVSCAEHTQKKVYTSPEITTLWDCWYSYCAVNQVSYGRFSWGPALFVCSWSKLTYWTPQEGSYIHCYSFVLAGSTKSRFGGTQIWRIQIPKFIFRWVLDPSNMGCPCFCYFSEGSRTRPDGPIKKIPKLLARFDCNLQLCLWPF